MTPIKRVNYFNGQLLSASDFQAEQDYHREKRRLQNRALLGSGVAEGLKVSAGKGNNAGSVSVTPGSAVDPAGELLTFCEPASLSLKSTANAVLVYLRYTERPVDAVNVPTDTSGGTSPPSRIEESCELVLVDEDSPTATKPRPADAASTNGVALARLVRTRAGWRVDRKFKVARV